MFGEIPKCVVDESWAAWLASRTESGKSDRQQTAENELQSKAKTTSTEAASETACFFEEAPIQAITEKMKKDQPNIAQTIKVEVVPLENVIGLLQTKDDEALKQIQLVPSEETIQFIQNKIKLQQAQEG